MRSRLRLQLRQQRLDRGADVADKAEVELAAAAEIFRADIDLGDLRVRRQELLVGKIGPEHQQHVAGMHRGIAGREADEAGHADVVGIVVLDVLLAAERMHDRALERLGQPHQAVMRAGTAAAAEQRDALGAVEEFGQRLQFAFGRPDDRRGRQQPGVRRDAALGRWTQRDVAGDDDDGDAAPPHRRANGVFQHVRQLRRIGNQFAIMAAFAEQILRMRLLEIAAADFGGRNLRGDRQHRRAAAVRIEQAVDEMQIAGAARARAHRKLAGDLRFAGGGEGRDLLMPDVDPVDRLALAQRVGEAVQAVADHAEDALDAGLGQRLCDEVCDIVDLHVGMILSQRPVNTAARFSRKALRPSTASALRRISACVSISRRN